MREWSVRAATIADHRAVAEMARANHDESCPHLEWSDERADETFLIDYLKYGDCTILIVAHRGRVVGFLLATINQYRAANGLFAVQEVLYVKPEKRGSRAAALLMQTLIAWARKMGAVEIVGGNDNGVRSDLTARFLSRFGFKNRGYCMGLNLNGR